MDYIIRTLFVLLFITSISGCGHQLKMSVSAPDYSDDGNQVLFSAICKGDATGNKIYSIDLINKKTQLLYAPDNEPFSSPRYLTDEEIIFSSYKESNACADICILNLDSKKRHCITKGGYGGSSLHVFSKQEKIYFRTACTDGESTRLEREGKGLYPKYDIYAIDFDGHNRTKLTNMQSYFIGSFSSPNKEDLLVFHRSDYKLEPSSIWIYDIKNPSISPFVPDLMPFIHDIAAEKELNAEEILHSTLVEIYGITISPKGNTIAFAWREPYTTTYDQNIYLANIKTKHVDKIEVGARIGKLSFSADGKKILFVDEDLSDYMNIWEIQRDGSGRRKIFDGKEFCGH